MEGLSALERCRRNLHLRHKRTTSARIRTRNLSYRILKAHANVPQFSPTSGSADFKTEDLVYLSQLQIR